ncbi:hypothetical protein AA0113_g90 [Alternaria arborescens]|uniref:Uncharacterized protein n=1 Tax=Alternaria arborescens TaxID=156630 RepID=A0A4Q4SR51_9PLEO|nr:hypothetical protein AA0111_g866 [Alternaria arborescens]RYN40265.1 hypothetical protein AA0112_g2953 [Alternaria arborescens]RYO41014.1 hypothetical protein AA0111_g866 [Alternaria arborescens]RYO73450.1 hypothetical protein AA0113_g90 [Alternaria arborescens]
MVALGCLRLPGHGGATAVCTLDDAAGMPREDWRANVELGGLMRIASSAFYRPAPLGGNGTWEKWHGDPYPPLPDWFPLEAL